MRGVILVLVLGVLFGIPMQAQKFEESRNPAYMASPWVPLDSWVYPALEKLTALGYVQTSFLSLRPWTRMECARQIEEVDELLETSRSQDDDVKRILADLRNEFAPEIARLNGERNVEASVESAYTRFTGIAGPALSDDFHFGRTVVNDYGRPNRRGANEIVGLSAFANAGPLAVYGRAEYQHAPGAPAYSSTVVEAISKSDFRLYEPPSAIDPYNRVRLVEGYAALAFSDYQLSFGRQSLWWGPEKGGPLLFSNNAEPITMLRLSRVKPQKLPFFLSWLGPVRGEFFIGQLGGHQFLHTQTADYPQTPGVTFSPQPFIHGQKLSFHPTPNFEFSISRTTIFGGPGFPFTISRFLDSLFSRGNSFGSSDPGDRRSGVDFTFRIPKASGLTLYLDAFAEDEISPIAYPDRSAILAGLYLPRVPGTTKWDFRLEGGYTDLHGFLHFPGFFYANVRYLEGYTNRGYLLGSWIGRQGIGMQAWTNYWLSPRNSVQFMWRHNQVDRQFLSGGNQQDFAVSATWTVRQNIDISPKLQIERWNFPLLSAGPERNVSGSVQFTYRPKRGAK
ncbi:MAG TPA: capsule assembly Wzi family protein [Terriglobales bacterium]|nr:capsule assembly Wzi family protein [Terriglobales bacterium]